MNTKQKAKIQLFLGSLAEKYRTNRDYFLSMDRYNMRNMRGIFGDDPYEKCHLLLEFTPQGGEVEDPWYSGDFGKAFEDIERGCAAFLAFVTKEERQ